MSVGPVILEARGVTKAFTTPDGRALPVLDGVSLTLREGEIVALLGRSGSGKSTFLRCIAGLISPSAGTVSYRGSPLNGANPGVAMVFQSFALLPWLTVQQNVELAMEAREVPLDARRERALRAIDLIGLDGFESAYPKELSGGMRQRVGFARALAVEPDALLMDEPFSALDVLTAANLRGELIRLWEGKEFPTDDLSFEVDDLLPLVDAAVLLGLAEVHGADLEITDAGREFATADIDASKMLFGKLAAERAPLIKAILNGLRATADGTLREGFFLDLLRRGFSDDEARRQLDIAIDWGRYGELYEYDKESGQLVLGTDPAKVGA